MRFKKAILNYMRDSKKRCCNNAQNLIKCFSALSKENLSSKEVRYMAKCAVCDKGVSFGIKLSHSHRKTNRAWKPNVQRVRALINGTPRRIYACTRCLRSDKVQRAG